MGCALVIGGIFKGIFGFLKWCFTNSWKGLVVLAIVVIVIIVGVNVVKNKLSDNQVITSKTTEQSILVPAIEVAPYLVKTDTRYYYAATAVKDKTTGIVTMNNYFELSGDKWQQVKTEITLDPGVFGQITISKRK